MSALSLSDAKAHLNLPSTSTTYDAELQSMIDAAEAIIGNVVGPLTAQDPRTDRVQGGNPLVLPVAPVASVASVVVAGGSAVDLAGVTVLKDAGVLRMADPSLDFTQPLYDVTYTPGRASVPADLLLAVKEMVRHLWETQRGSSQRPGTSDEPEPTGGYLMPWRVEELIEPYRFVRIGAA